MCGRYAISYDSEEIAAQFRYYNLEVQPHLSENEHHERSYNVAPTNHAAVYRSKDHELRYMKWGLVPHWAKDASEFKTYKTFNARLENLQESKMWIQCCDKKRCVVPISGYYEWRTEGKVKLPYYITRKDGKLLFLAGMYDYVESDNLWTFTIITGTAPPELDWLHHRMPVVLEPGQDAWNAWMDPEKFKWSQRDLNDLLVATYNDEMMTVYRVSSDVGKVKIDHERLIKPIFKKDNVKSELKWEKGPDNGDPMEKKSMGTRGEESVADTETKYSSSKEEGVKDEAHEEGLKRGRKKRNVLEMLASQSNKRRRE